MRDLGREQIDIEKKALIFKYSELDWVKNWLNVPLCHQFVKIGITFSLIGGYFVLE